MAADYNYDNPMILGSERTGPDLSYIGRKRSQQWEIDHLKDPRQFSPLSIMPDFDFLSDSDLRAISEYLYYLGDRNAAEFMIESPEPYQASAPPEFPQALQSTDPSAAASRVADVQAVGPVRGQADLRLALHHVPRVRGQWAWDVRRHAHRHASQLQGRSVPNMPDDQWFWHVSEGVQGSVMPPWKESLTESQRWNVIRYVQQVYAQPFERDPDEGDVPAEYDQKNPLPITIDNIDAGKRIWTRECAVCHGDAATRRGHLPRRESSRSRPTSRRSPTSGPFTDARLLLAHQRGRAVDGDADVEARLQRDRALAARDLHPDDVHADHGAASAAH